MKKKIICIISVILLLILGGTIYFYPRSLDQLVGPNDEIVLCYYKPEYQEDDQSTDFNNKNYDFPPNSEKSKQIISLLSKYNYHRYVRTLFTTDLVSLNNRSLDYYFVMYLNDTNSSDLKQITFIGDGRILIENHLYKMDIMESKKQTAFMEELKSIVES